MAQPLPVQRQKKLFDHTREAEKVVVYYNVQPSSWLLHIGAALYGITEASGHVITTVANIASNGGRQYQV